MNLANAKELLVEQIEISRVNNTGTVPDIPSG